MRIWSSLRVRFLLLFLPLVLAATAISVLRVFSARTLYEALDDLEEARTQASNADRFTVLASKELLVAPVALLGGAPIAVGTSFGRSTEALRVWHAGVVKAQELIEVALLEALTRTYAALTAELSDTGSQPDAGRLRDSVVALVEQLIQLEEADLRDALRRIDHALRRTPLTPVSLHDASDELRQHALERVQARRFVRHGGRPIEEVAWALIRGAPAPSPSRLPLMRETTERALAAWGGLVQLGRDSARREIAAADLMVLARLHGRAQALADSAVGLMRQGRPDAAVLLFATVIEPHLRDELVPRALTAHAQTGRLVDEGVATLATAGRRMVWLSGMVILLVVIGAVGAPLVFSRTVIDRLVSLTRATGRIAAGEPGVHLDVRSSDEIGELERSFATMAARVAENKQQLVEHAATLERRVAERTVALEAATRAAQSSAEAKSEFLANMSHEIRTPLNGVIGMTGLLLGGELATRERELAETLRRSAETLLVIINDILDFSKIEAGRFSLELIPFAPERVLRDVGSLLAAAAGVKNIELILRVAPGTPSHVLGDGSRITQILTNLVGNAVKFTERGHVLVTVECETDPDNSIAPLRFSVQDTGIGIAAEKLDLIWDKFTQADASTTRRYGGTGLGLAIAKRIVELMEGEIGVESSPSKGSTFWFRVRLPVVATRSPEEQAGKAARLVEQRVLVVDDNVVNLRVFTELFTGWGIRYEQASSGAAALRALHDGRVAGDPFDIVVTDYLMPDMDGVQLARAIRKDASPSDTALVIVSSVGERPSASQAPELGIGAWLVKPAAPSDLLDALLNALRSDGERDAAEPHFTPAGVGQLRARVLVAEDNGVNQTLLKAILERFGCQVDLAGDGVEAVRMATQFPYDVIFMDGGMPEMDGFEATQAIRRGETGDRHVPIIAVTAYAAPADRDRCIAAGMDDYVSKPVRVPELRAALERALGARRAAVPPPAENGSRTMTHAGLLAHFGADQALLTELIHLFTAGVPGWMQDIRVAVDAADPPRLERAAHVLKGAAANFEAAAVVHAARGLETAGRSGDLGDARMRVQSLEVLTQRLVHELAAFTVSAS